MRDLIIKCVEAANGWQFIPKHQLIKIPGFTEPTSVMKVNPVTQDALAAQLIRQIDESENFSFKQSKDGRAVVVNKKPKTGQPMRASGNHGNRSITALKVIEASGFIK